VGSDRARAFVLTTATARGGETGLVTRLRRGLPELKIVAGARDPQHAAILTAAGATEAVPDALASSLHLAQSVIRSFGLPETDLNQLMSEYAEKEKSAA
jgi:CPA2 family monovalent cation:H+ antiporter-2